MRGESAGGVCVVGDCGLYCRGVLMTAAAVAVVLVLLLPVDRSINTVLPCAAAVPVLLVGAAGATDRCSL
jgi:hypothetical protein